MEEVIFRFSIVWILLHIILFFVEWYRYKHGDLPWNAFKHHGMLDITCGILAIDMLCISIAIIIGLPYWIFQPIIK